MTALALVGVLVLLPVLPATAAGVAATAKAPLLAGFAAYKADGAEAAVRLWVAGGVLEKSGEFIARKVRDLRRVEELYGLYQGYQIVRTVEVSRTCQLFYVQLDYADGPLFVKFMVYRSRENWRVIRLRFHTEIERIWPEDLAGPAEEDGAAPA